MPAAELELRRLKVRLREREERYAGKSFLSRAEKWFPIAYILLGVIYAYYSYVVVFSYWKVALHDGNVMVSIGLLVPAHIILLFFVIIALLLVILVMFQLNGARNRVRKCVSSAHHQGIDQTEPNIAGNAILVFFALIITVLLSITVLDSRHKSSSF